jgi:hypothetical protein
MNESGSGHDCSNFANQNGARASVTEVSWRVDYGRVDGSGTLIIISQMNGVTVQYVYPVGDKQSNQPWENMNAEFMQNCITCSSSDHYGVPR